MRIDRLLAITVLMLSRDRVTAQELAEKFEVSLRTVYRDFEAMSLAGIPVVSRQGNGGGYSLMETYKLDRRLLKPQDFQAILSSLSGLNRTLGDPGMQSALEKIRSLLPREAETDSPGFCEQLVIDLFPWSRNRGQVDKIREVHRAISESKLLRFQYQNANGEGSSRRVEPMTLVFKGYGWYLFAYCLGRGDFRFFKINRMKEIEICGESFSRRPADYESCLPAAKPANETIDLVLEFEPEMAPHLEEIFPQEPRTTMANDRIRIQASVPGGDWVLGMVLSYGPQVRVISPSWIRDRVADAAKKICSLYQT